MFTLTGTNLIPDDGFVNLAATTVVDGTGKQHTRLVKGQVIEAETIEHPERLQGAVDRGHLTIEET